MERFILGDFHSQQGVKIKKSALIKLKYKYQRHCLRLIYPNLENSASRLETAGLTTVSVQLENQCHRYTQRIRSDTTHALHDYIHTGGRISSRSGRFIPARTRTALGSKNLFRHY